MERTLKNRAKEPASVTFYARKSQGIRSSSSLYSTSWKKERVKSISILEWKKNLEILQSVREKIEPNRRRRVSQRED